MNNSMKMKELSTAEVMAVAGGDCSLHDFGQEAVKGGMTGATVGVRGGPVAALEGAALGAAFGVAAHGATCWW